MLAAGVRPAGSLEQVVVAALAMADGGRAAAAAGAAPRTQGQPDKGDRTQGCGGFDCIAGCQMGRGLWG